MQRVGYDADTQVYTYQDADGSVWEGDEGNRYGQLRRVGHSAPHFHPVDVRFYSSASVKLAYLATPD